MFPFVTRCYLDRPVHEHAVLLVGGEELVDLGQVEQLVKLRLLHLRPHRPLDLYLIKARCNHDPGQMGTL